MNFIRGIIGLEKIFLIDLLLNKRLLVRAAALNGTGTYGI